jgi:YgiT-type zinc finger domain-containing protein
MRCSNCHNGELREERRHKSAVKDGRVAVVTDIPVTVCPSCQTVWYAEDVAIALDAMLTEMLEQDTLAVRPFQEPATSAA